MKKILALVLVLAMVAALFVGCKPADQNENGATKAPAEQTTAAPGNDETKEPTSDIGKGMKVAMVTDYGDITDESFNQATYEGAKEWCEANGADFTYYKPTGDSTEARVAAIEKAIDEGYTTLLMQPFEGTQIPIPIGYHEILSNYYDDYMKEDRTPGHDYPFYEEQLGILKNYLQQNPQVYSDRLKKILE